MRFLFLVVLAFCLLSPACERVVPIEPEDAGVVQPPRDAATDGGTSLDARTPRPGAGPLDPDLTIDCVTSTTYVSYVNTQTGLEYYRSYSGRAVWPETGNPPEAWLCYTDPVATPNCNFYTPEMCSVVGSDLYRQACVSAMWQVEPDGRFFIACGGRSEQDMDGDGTFETQIPPYNGGQYVAVIR